MPAKRTAKKSKENRAVKKMLSMPSDIWERADLMADEKGTTRSAIVAQAIAALWTDRETGEERCGQQD